ATWACRCSVCGVRPGSPPSRQRCPWLAGYPGPRSWASTTYLLIYIIGHLLSAVLIGFMLGRLRLIPAWAAWAFALTSPLTILIFPVHNLVFQDALKYLICALWIIGAIPAALAMLKNKDLALLAEFFGQQNAQE
ncbi:MAG TPA: hypothetical protein VEL69_00615, partial [Ktedonobacteraceae bacterium]|nr:hypothetical protein [Ktedonobacteraceae bacterium]